MPHPQTYRASGPLYARATTLDQPLPAPADLDFDTNPTDLAEAGIAWLRQLWRNQEFVAALRVASPDLTSRIDEILTDPAARPRRIRSLLQSVYSYTLRWQRRATPYGLFAGVAPAAVGETTKTRFGTGHTVVRHPDAAWCHALVDRAETDPDLLAGLLVRVNTLATHRGGRIWVDVSTTDAQLEAGKTAETSVKASAPVLTVLDAAARPVRFGDLAHQLTEQFAGVAAEKVAALLRQLVAAGVLITNARPAMTTEPTDWPTHHTRQSETGRVEAVHLRLDADMTLPGAVLEEAARAASVLQHLSASPYGAPAWRDYLQRFHERYGACALVPVRDLVADSGLGYPIGYLGAAAAKTPRVASDRDAAVLALLQEAHLAGRDEIVVTEQVIDRLRVGDGADCIPPPRTEVMFRIAADSPGDVDAGRFRLWLSGTPGPQSSLTGRFIPLLPTGYREEFAASYLRDGLIAAQLSFPPRKARNGNVAAVPALLPDVIPLGEHPPTNGRVIEVDELAVTADATQLYLIHASSGQPVEAHVLHALDGTVHTPALARFLSEVSGATRCWQGPVDLGIARTLPYLPRLRTGRTILAGARWLINAADFPTATGDWEETFTAWRERWRVPDAVELTWGDQKLPLDLTDRLDRQLMRSRLNKHKKLELVEHEPASATAWAGRACEFVATLHTSQPTPRPPMATAPAAPLALPGSGLVAATLFGHPRRAGELITDHLPVLTRDLDGELAAWWFNRFHDNARPDAPHVIHLRLRPTDDDPALVTAELRDWAARLHEAGLLADFHLTGYRPAAGRYGTDIPATEAVFAADSRAALAELATGVSIDALAAVSMVDIAVGIAGDETRGWRWILDTLAHEAVSIDAEVRDTAFALATRPPAGPVGDAWQHRRHVLAAYRAALTDRPASGVLRSLLHDHAIRCLGVDPDRERAVNRLVRAVANRNLHTGTPS